MDGFGVCFLGNTLRIKYQGEITLKEFHKGDFEGDIEQRLIDMRKSEIESGVIGELVIDALKDLDKVAYIRFASVYRDFKDVEDFEKELQRLTQNTEADET